MSEFGVPLRTYIAYRHRRFNWQPLFDELNTGKTQTEVALAYNVPQSTLSRRYSKYRIGIENDDPNAIAEAVGGADGRRRSHRALTDDQEMQIHRDYKSTTAAGIAVNNDDLSTIAVRVYHRDHPHHTRSHTFAASDSFIRRYKRDHHMSTGVVKKPHHPPSRPSDELRYIEATEFFDAANSALCKYKKSMIIDFDETSGKVVMPPRTALRDVGSGPAIAHHKLKDKLCATIGTAITANGTKLKSALITKGKTPLSLRKFRLPSSFVGLLNTRG